MTSKVVKSTSKGQITLPKQWRDQYKTDNYLLRIDMQQITIRPIHLDQASNEEIIFDADRDNDGKGVTVSEMIRLLKKI